MAAVITVVAIPAMLAVVTLTLWVLSLYRCPYRYCCRCTGGRCPVCGGSGRTLRPGARAVHRLARVRRRERARAPAPSGSPRQCHLAHLPPTASPGKIKIVPAGSPPPRVPAERPVLQFRLGKR